MPRGVQQLQSPPVPRKLKGRDTNYVELKQQKVT